MILAGTSFLSLSPLVTVLNRENSKSKGQIKTKNIHTHTKKKQRKGTVWHLLRVSVTRFRILNFAPRYRMFLIKPTDNAREKEQKGKN